MFSGYFERALNYLTYDSNKSRKRNSRGMNISDEVEYTPALKRLRTDLQESEVAQNSTWRSSIVDKIRRCGGFFSHTVGSVFNRSLPKRTSNMESSHKKRNWAVKNTKPGLIRSPLQQSQPQYYNPFVSESSNINLPEIINVENSNSDDDDDDDDCVEIPISDKLIIPNYNAIYNSEEENLYPSSKRTESSHKKKSSFLSLSQSNLPKIEKKVKKKKFTKRHHLYCPSVMTPVCESFRQDEKEKYNMLLELQQYAGASSYSSFHEANIKLAPKLASQKTVSVQTERKVPKSNAFFKVNLTDSDKINQIEKIKKNKPLEASSWDKKAQANEHVFQIPHLRVGIPSKSYIMLPSEQSRGAFSVKRESHLNKARSTESLTLPANSPQSYNKSRTPISNFQNVFSRSPLHTATSEYGAKSLERKSGRASVFDTEYFSEKWLNELRDNVDKSSRTQSEKAQHEELKYQILQEEKLSKQFEANRKSLANIDSKFSMTLSSKYDESEDEDSCQLPELTAEMQREIDQALIPNPQDEVLVHSFGIKITRKDMETLSGLNWLNDEIINFYTNLMMERGKNENYPSCYAFNTFFYPKLINSGHSALKRWTRKIDIFAHDIILIPVHLGMHWCLAVIDFRHKKIQYFDSMGGQNNECLNALKNYLQEESLDKKNMPYDTSEWKLEMVKNIPQQMNGSDCGMFTCKFAECITRNAKITFSQRDMPHFRRLMVYEIVNKKLM